MPFYYLLKSYLSERSFRVKQEQSYSELKKIRGGVPQGSVLAPVLYVLFTQDVPHPQQTTMATFADDTAILAIGETIEESTNKLQSAVNKVVQWTSEWKIKLNETKSVHVNFTNKTVPCLPIYVNEIQFPYANTAKYLGMTLDAKLRWKEHIKKKKEQLDLTYRKMYWLLGRKSELSTQNKLMVYKQVLKPIWTYGIELWGCAKPTNIQSIQKFQNKVLRSIVNAPWYVRNADLHKDLGMGSVEEEIKLHAAKHEQRLHCHPNVEVIRLLDNSEDTRRLKLQKPLDLV